MAGATVAAACARRLASLLEHEVGTDAAATDVVRAAVRDSSVESVDDFRWILDQTRHRQGTLQAPAPWLSPTA